MLNFITENDIEQIILSRLSKFPYEYEIFKCDPSPASKDDLKDGTYRTDKKQCILPNVLLRKLYDLNPSIPKEELKKFFDEELMMDYRYRLNAIDLIISSILFSFWVH